MLWDGRSPADETRLCAILIRIRCHKGSIPFVATVTKGVLNLKWNTKTLTALSLLIAIEIVLSRFLSISAWNIKIGFSFVPIVIAAILYGPLPAGVVAALGDFVGAILFPIGPYFPGFTLTAFLTGIVFGLFLQKSQDIGRIALAVGVNQLLLSLLLNTLWISVLYEAAYLPLLATRVIQCVILSVVQFVGIRLIAEVLVRYRKSAEG